MATLTDEEKAGKVLDGVDEVKPQDEPVETTTDQTNESEASPEETTATDEEKPQESETAEESTATFTKQFQNLKGESWDEYGPNLETAYQNSFSEGLKLRQQLDEAQKRVTELQSQPVQPVPTVTPPVPTSSVNPETQALLDWAKSRQQTEMLDAFGEFATKFPQAQEVTSNDVAFRQFESASGGVRNALYSATGREPSYKDLFEKTAAVLGWDASDTTARKDAAIKDQTAAPGTTGASTQPAAKQSSISESQLVVARRLWPGKSDSDLLKELAEYKT